MNNIGSVAIKENMKNLPKMKTWNVWIKWQITILGGEKHNKMQEYTDRQFNKLRKQIIEKNEYITKEI